MNDSRYTFVSVSRTGAAAAIPDVDTFDANTHGRATFTASFTLAGNVSSNDVSQSLLLNGPGDVISLDPRQVIRTEPKALTQNYEPNFFAAVEFDRPDLPWLFTPARETALVPNPTDPTTASARLRPWVVLVVVRQQDGVSLGMAAGQSLPVLAIKAPAVVADELQDLGDSWAWAHAQTVGDASEADGVLRNGPPEHNSSRLLCPKKLQAATPYLACVVPAFKLGVLAGMGLPITAADEGKLDPAWTAADSAVQLPVYFHWSFNTGPNGDFEALADLLSPQSLTANDVTVPLDIKDTGDARLPADAPDILLDGALTAGTPPSFDQADYQAALATIVSQPDPTLNPDDPDPVVAPPLYGRWHAAQQSVAPGSTWLADLNLDPRRRIAAGLGTKVVQDQQEQLMASAWDQLGEIEKVNQILRRAQLAREAGNAAHAKTVASVQGDTDAAFALTGPVQRRILDGSVTMALKLQESRVPEGLVSPVFRKLLRPRGALFTRLSASFGDGIRPSAIEGLNGGSESSMTILPDKTDTGMVDGRTIDTGIATHVLDDPARPVPPVVEPDPVEPNPFTQLRDPTVDVHQFHDVALDLQQFLGSASGPKQTRPPSSRPALDTTYGGLAATLIFPGTTVPARVLSRITLNGAPLAARTGDVLEPILAAPEFPQPMYVALRDLSPEFMVPGIFRVPPNTVTLLDTNRAFIEAYMVGLNHEMARELLWRGYPTDQRGTYFAQFWDPSCRVPPALTQADRDARKDITPIHTWALSSRLGDHQPPDSGRTPGNEIVLVIRGELLRRYPNTIVYAAPGVTDNAGNFNLDEANEEIPIFRGTIPPDVTFLGFNLTEQDVRDRQLYFVLQEQPTEPRFGLNDVDAADIDPAQPLGTWDDLAWGHFGPQPRFLNVATLPNAASLPPVGAETPLWGVNAAHMARITLQTPVRVAIFGPDILPH